MSFEWDSVIWLVLEKINVMLILRNQFYAIRNTISLLLNKKESNSEGEKKERQKQEGESVPYKCT